MKSKKLLSVFVILVIIVGLVLIAFVPRKFTKEVAINSTLQKMMQQFHEPAKMANWYLPFAEADTAAKKIDIADARITYGDYYLQTSEASLTDLIFKTGNKEDEQEVAFSVTADTLNAHMMFVTLTYFSNLASKLTGGNKIIENAVKSLDNLKEYMETSKRYYGFNIQLAPVTDTSFLFGTSTVDPGDLKKGTEELFKNLVAFSMLKNADYNGVRILYTSNTVEGKIKLYAGVGVSNRLITNPSDSFQYKQMPVGKNLLVADFEGPYNEVGKAYRALEQYISDQKLVNMAMPFHKFITEGYSFDDTQTVKLKVTYPVL